MFFIVNAWYIFNMDFIRTFIESSQQPCSFNYVNILINLTFFIVWITVIVIFAKRQIELKKSNQKGGLNLTILIAIFIVGFLLQYRLLVNANIYNICLGGMKSPRSINSINDLRDY